MEFTMPDREDITPIVESKRSLQNSIIQHLILAVITPHNKWANISETISPEMQGHPTDLFLTISVLQRKFCWLGTEVSAVLLGSKVLNLRSRIYQMYQKFLLEVFYPSNLLEIFFVRELCAWSLSECLDKFHNFTIFNFYDVITLELY